MLKIIFSILSVLALAKGDPPLEYERYILDTHTYRDNAARNTEGVYRLPHNVVPLKYDIYIDLYFGERTDKPYSYEGSEDIIIQAVEANVTQITLHANVDSIDGISVLTASGQPLPLNVLNPFYTEPRYHFLKINLAEALQETVNYTLSIKYSNIMNKGPLKRGIWRGWYTDANGIERIYAATHFQPYNARQAFPCWDEPMFKAVFQLHLSRPTSYVGRFSNTGIETTNILGNNRVRDDFYPTPKMSSYLVTFLVSETFQVIAEDTSFIPPVRIIGRSNTVGLANHTLELAVKMTEHFSEYFEIPYSTLHPNLHNDHISSPDWASAGTENWGMVSYRELYLIIDPNVTLMSVEHYATTLVAHEIAHKWFGNLITCFWWSNTWINEGFASYFGYIAANEMFPKYDLPEHFNIRYLQNSLSYDSGVSSEPMNYDVNTPSQVSGHFGTISYSKGAAFLRMTVDIVSPATFKKACKYFLMENAYEPTDQYDLLAAFTEAIVEDNSLTGYLNFNFSDYYRIWVNEPGYPILNVEINHNTGDMNLSQERFFLSSTATPTGQIYPIPITYSTKSNPNFEELKPIYIMADEKIVLEKAPGEEWVIFNNLQHGHYRVNYDDDTWNLIAEALLNEPESIHYLNRAQIVDDVFALMRSEKMTYTFGFNILKFLRNEVNYYVWNPAITGYTWLRNRLRHIPEKQAEFDAYLLSYLENVIEAVEFDSLPNESPTMTMTRETVLHFACMLGHEQCVQESRERFVALRDNNAWVNVGIRRNVYVTGIREGGQQDFQFLLNRFYQSNYANDQLEMLRGLAATKDSQLLNQYLQLSLTKEVRAHDKTNSFNYALLGNKENAYHVLQFVKSNIDAIRVAFVEDSPPNPVQTILSNLAGYLDEPYLVEYQEWLQSTQTSSAQYSATLAAINSARNNMAWGTNNVDILLTAARDSAATAVTSLALLLVVACVAIVV